MAVVTMIITVIISPSSQHVLSHLQVRGSGPALETDIPVPSLGPTVLPGDKAVSICTQPPVEGSMLVE